MKLSILIASLKSRSVKLLHLIADLDHQILDGPTSFKDLVEVLYDDGDQTVGAKRNALLARAKGEYVCFIDDDDKVSLRYVEGILDALAGDPDCVAIHGEIRNPPKPPRPFLVTHHATVNAPPDLYCRTTNHLSPVRRLIAKHVGFADLNAGEDCDYAVRLYQLLNTEAIADPALTRYFYNHSTSDSATYHETECELYRNAFGGDFAFEFDVRVEGSFGGVVQLWVNNDCRISSEPPGDVRVRVARRYDDDDVVITMNGYSVGYVPIDFPDRPTRVALRRTPGVKFLGIAKCVVSGRRVDLQYVRNF